MSTKTPDFREVIDTIQKDAPEGVDVHADAGTKLDPVRPYTLVEVVDDSEECPDIFLKILATGNLDGMTWLLGELHEKYETKNELHIVETSLLDQHAETVELS